MRPTCDSCGLGLASRAAVVRGVAVTLLATKLGGLGVLLAGGDRAAAAVFAAGCTRSQLTLAMRMVWQGCVVLGAALWHSSESAGAACFVCQFVCCYRM